jgi:hypothetical protein
LVLDDEMKMNSQWNSQSNWYNNILHCTYFNGYSSITNTFSFEKRIKTEIDNLPSSSYWWTSQMQYLEQKSLSFKLSTKFVN